MKSLYDKHLNEKFLRWWFEKKHETSNHLASIFNSKYPDYKIRAGQVIQLCKLYNIKTPTIRESKFCPRVHKLSEGKNNILAKGNIGYLKRQEHLKEEGITNVFQREDVKIKSKNTLFEKYGVYNPCQLPNYRRNYGFESNEHLKVIDFLKNRNIECISDLKNESKAKFCKFNEDLGRVYSPRPDILIEESKIIIEIYGDLWHANPKKFDDDYIIHKWGGNFTAKEIRDFDEIRKKHLESFGYKVFEIWTCDIYNDEKLNNILDNIFK